MLCLPLPPQDQASEAMEVFNELMESEMSIIVPHITDIVGFCLEVGAELSGLLPGFLFLILKVIFFDDVCLMCLRQVGGDTTLTDSLRVKALSCIGFLIKLKSKVTLTVCCF